MRIAFNFMVCEALHMKRTRYLYEEQCKLIRERGWDMFLFGGFEQIDEIPIIKVCDRDDYLSCIEKMYEMLKFHEETEYDWYFFGDDDTFINLKNLEKLLRELDVKELKLYGNVSRYKGIMHVHGGGGIIMSKRLLVLLGEHVNIFGKMCHEKFSDVSLGMLVGRYNEGKGEMERIGFENVGEMYDANKNLSFLDYGGCVSIHMKDRISFEELRRRCE